MIKAFEEFTPVQNVTINGQSGLTQWKKTYSDGETAKLVIEDYKITRAIVRDTFSAQEGKYQYLAPHRRN